MKRTNRLVAAVAALLVFCPPAAFSGDARDGRAPASGKPEPGPMIHGWDGTSERAVKTDPNGILRVTEEYPRELQTEITTLATSEPVTTGFKMLGNSWSGHPFGDRVFRIRRVATGGNAVGIVRLFLFGSDDNVNFFPVMNATAWGKGVLADTALVDTLSITLPQANATLELKITIPAADTYPGRYLALYGLRDSVSGSAQAITITAEGRYK